MPISRPKTLPEDSLGRKQTPLITGVMDYFPDAMIYVAKVSWFGNEKHNPGQTLYHNREKSADEADSILRHLLERGTPDPESGLPASAHMAWRALSLLQKELEEAGLATLPRGARYPSKEAK